MENFSFFKKKIRVLTGVYVGICNFATQYEGIVSQQQRSCTSCSWVLPAVLFTCCFQKQSTVHKHETQALLRKQSIKMQCNALDVYYYINTDSYIDHLVLECICLWCTSGVGKIVFTGRLAETIGLR